MKKGAILITTEQKMKKIVPANGTDFTLEELKRFVGGWIEIINLNPRVIMIVNEEGKGVLEPNGFATVMAKAMNAIFPDDYIAGNAVMCPSDMVK